ncbi:MAG: hypothetical protein IPI90_15750 [Saprospiraceae bacterium]|nr:hypothetical protein [Candidatus Vicinibacter affinis]
MGDFLFQNERQTPKKIKSELDAEIRKLPKVSGADKQYLSNEVSQILISTKK